MTSLLGIVWLKLFAIQLKWMIDILSGYGIMLFQNVTIFFHMNILFANHEGLH